MSASLSVFEREHESREKYIYFICGVASALLAYLGKDYKPSHPWTTHDTLTVSTLGCLLMVFVFGTGRILCYTHGLSANKEKLVAQEETANFVEKLARRLENEQKGVALSINKLTGRFVTKEEIQKNIDATSALYTKHEKRERKWFNVSTVLFVICHIFLVGAFALMMWAKLVS